MTFWLKACPKCAGDLRLQPDLTGLYVACVQCGLELNSAQERLLRGPGYPGHDQSKSFTPVDSGSPHHQVA